MLSKTIASLAAACLIVGSSAAAAAPAQSLSVANAPAVERAGAEAEGASELRGTTGWFIGAVALALIIWGAIELFDDGDPESP